ncbi:hypothetical protein EJ06DRAFT_388169 [Trichodelitschia bisporula]|uniref:Zn(2)-C6 fungal-type domain-containing protein n=1 Tax=Trichodelitschia bisporula TaxID=703511 RepID=A0A6G1HZ58_9PEZI|nr:hypothetical protein EJ06DRAFT_388169 [Trichodelitschia bisporula]
MGRKPNPVIQAYFNRGAKLDDASNRYEHTCKKCGAEFRKGRPETLSNHIEKKCPSISDAEREKFRHELELSSRPTGKKSHHGTSPQSNDLSGLEALAEVSRQHGHLDYSQQSTMGDEFLNTDGHMDLGEPENVSQFSGHHNGNISSLPSAGSMQSLLQYTFAPPPSAPVAPMVPSRSLQMAEAALALDPQLGGLTRQPGIDSHFATSHASGTNRDQQLNIDGRNQGATFSSYLSQATLGLSSPTENTFPPRMDFLSNAPQLVPYHTPSTLLREPPRESTPEPSPPPMLPDISSESPAGEDQPVRKVRGSFQPERRSAVKEVRKKGACLRCRMLKKSCDSNDPCAECAKLETARLWKSKCIRVRLITLFDVYSSGFFLLNSHHRIEALKQTGGYQEMPGRIEATCHIQAGVVMTFPYLQTTPSANESPLYFINTESPIILERIRFGDKLSRYASKLLQKHRASPNQVFGVSSFMNQTILAAMDLGNKANRWPGDKSTVDKALELWVCTNILQCGPSDLHVFVNQGSPPTGPATVNLMDGDESDHVVIDGNLVLVQLRRAAEKACEQLLKAIMPDIEKNLITRKDTNKFETFLVTVILLRCVEMLCCLYKGLERSYSNQEAVNPSLQGLSFGSPPEQLPGSAWPLDKPASHYWMQGEDFADMLCSMLKLRKIPPKIIARDGVLCAAESEDEHVKRWINPIGLTPDMLAQARERSYDMPDESGWEFRWTSLALVNFAS